MKLYEKGKRVKYSKNDKRFYSQLDMAQLKQDEAISNSRFKRGEKKELHSVISVCSCGADGCFGLL